MKTAITYLFALFLFYTSGISQSPDKMSYQAVLRSQNGVLLTNTSVGMQISILSASSSGISVFTERHFPLSNANGLVTLEIGTGTTVSGNFATINWANGPYFLKTETDPNGGSNYTISGSSELMSVPYALHAKTAEFVTGPVNETDPVFTASVAAGIGAADTASWNQKLDQEVDGSVSNELQTLSKNGLTVSLSQGGGSFTDSINVYTAGNGISISDNVISLNGILGGHYIGELFGGGIVFWVSPDRAHGLVTSLSDLDGGSGVAWSNVTGGSIGTAAQNMTNGAGNTVAVQAQAGHVNSAAKLCATHNGGGFTDWYLPSNREFHLLAAQDVLIDQIFDNDNNSATNGFVQDYLPPNHGKYWTSTEALSTHAWFYRFDWGTTDGGNKGDSFRVRAIRAF